MDLALEDGESLAVALGGGIGMHCWVAVEDAAVALGSTSGRRICNDDVRISVAKA